MAKKGLGSDDIERLEQASLSDHFGPYALGLFAPVLATACPLITLPPICGCILVSIYTI